MNMHTRVCMYVYVWNHLYQATLLACSNFRKIRLINNSSAGTDEKQKAN